MDIAVAAPHKNQYSETFIHNLVRLLPAEVHYFYGGYLPYFVNGLPLIELPVSDEDFAQKIFSVGHHLIKSKLEKRVAGYLKGHAVKAVLANYGPTGVHMLQPCLTANVPLIVFFRGYDIYRQQELEQYGKAYQDLFHKADAFIAVSKAIKQRLIDLGCAEDKIVYCPSGANTAIFTPIDAGKNPPTFISVGRFSETKSPDKTIRAFAEAYETNPDMRLKMIGEGELLNTCKELVKQLDLKETISFPGILTQDEIAREMANCRGFIQHSVTNKNGEMEGTPVAILEAGASGLPVVATRHAGIPEVIVDGETGFLVEEGDEKNMTRFIVRLADDPALASRMGQQASVHIRGNFTVQHHLDKVWSTIENVVTKH